MIWTIILSFYVASLIGCLIVFDRLNDDWDEFQKSEYGDSMFTGNIINGIGSIIPILNTFLFVTTLRDIVVERFTMWLIKRKVNRILKKSRRKL